MARAKMAAVLALLCLLGGCGARTPWGWAGGLEDRQVSHVTRWGPSLREELTDGEIRGLLAALQEIRQEDCRKTDEALSSEWRLTLHCADGQYVLYDAGDGQIGLRLDGQSWLADCPAAVILMHRREMPGFPPCET